MESQLHQFLDELHSFEAYFKNVIFRNNNLVVPYINLGISDHFLNPSHKMKYIDYSYVVAEDVRFMDTWIKNEVDFNGRRYTIIGTIANEPIYYLGGYNLDSNSVFNDLQVCCKNAYIMPCDHAKWTENHTSFDLDEKNHLNGRQVAFFDRPLPALVEAFIN